MSFYDVVFSINLLETKVAVGRYFLIVLAFTSIDSFGSISDSVILSQQGKRYDVNLHIRVFETSDSLSGAEAYRKIRSGELTSVKYRTNPGLRDPESAFWILFSVKNESISDPDLFLELKYPQMDYVELFKIHEEEVKNLYVTGDIFPFDQRPVSHHNFVFPIKIPEGTSSTFLLNAEKRRSVSRFPLSIYDSKYFQKKNIRESVYFGGYFGIVIIVILLSLVVGAILKKQVFFWYAFYIAGFGFWLFSRSGFTYEFITGNFPEFNRHLLPVVTQFTIMMLIGYVQSYFKTRETLPVFHKVMNGIFIFFCLAYAVWAAFPDFFINNAPRLFILRYTITISIVIFAYYAAIRSLKVHPFKAKIFLAGYSMVFLAMIAKILAEFGVFSESSLLLDPIMIGFLIEVIVLTLAMTSILLGVIKQRESLISSNKSLQDRLNSLKEGNNESSFINLKGKAVLPLREIMYIRSDEHYLKIYLSNEEFPQIVRYTLSSLAKQLPPHFIQVHRSIIVNLEFVKNIYANEVIMKDQTSLPISRKYKESVKDFMLT